jgi:hypothetical protein
VVGLGYYAWTSTRRPEIPNSTLKPESSVTATATETATVAAPVYKPPTPIATTSATTVATVAPVETVRVQVPKPRSSKTEDPTTNPLLLQRN